MVRAFQVKFTVFGIVSIAHVELSDVAVAL